MALLFESLLRYPNQVFYTCRGGYSLDRKLGNATNVSSTNVRLCLPRTLDGYFQYWRVFASRAVAPLATSISIVSSVSHFGVSFVSGEVAHHVCRHGHTVDGNSGAEYGDTPPVFTCMKADNTKRASVCGYGEDCASALRGSGARMLETHLLRRADIQQRSCFPELLRMSVRRATRPQVTKAT